MVFTHFVDTFHFFFCLFFTDNQLEKQIVITISREYGSGGRYIGRLIADRLGIKLYDKDFITKVAEETGLSEEYIEKDKIALLILFPIAWKKIPDGI